jgi:hypothetical protein
MLTPLRLIERLSGRNWEVVSLTAHGVRVATDPDTSAAFEDVLSEMRFCQAPWFTDERSAQYADYDVAPYQATLAVLNACGGRLEADEFSLFVSRIRHDAEVNWAIKMILAYRSLKSDDQAVLFQEVSKRILSDTGDPAKKIYQNWRDMAHHTFSLFALGRSVTKVGRELVLTAGTVGIAETPAKKKAVPKAKITKGGSVTAPKQLLVLPAAPDNEELQTPPVLPQINNGGAAEIYVGKLLSASGWEVAYYTNKRGYGFDLWAKKAEFSYVMEIKSSIGAMSSINLTRMERDAANHYKSNYLLVIVENANAEIPKISVVQDPTTKLEVSEVDQKEYRVSAADWREHSVGFQAN